MVDQQNSTVNRATGYSPHFLLFGRHSHLPIDLMFGISETSSPSSSSESESDFEIDPSRLETFIDNRVKNFQGENSRSDNSDIPEPVDNSDIPDPIIDVPDPFNTAVPESVDNSDTPDFILFINIINPWLDIIQTACKVIISM